MIVTVVIVVAVVLVGLGVGFVVVRHKRAAHSDTHSDVPPGTHSRSFKPPIGAQDTNDPIAPPEAAVDQPTDTPDDASPIAAPEAGVPSPSKNDR